MNFQELKNQKKIHFIGLGGIGMSALALILREFKIPVQGSDLTENYLTPKLRDKQITYFVGHKKENISDDVSLIVQTSIIKTNNPEILAAEVRGIPIMTRANLLALIMREYKGITIAGTHGKTSTTAMVALMLEIGGLDPTVINGGVIHYFASNSKIGKGKYLVAESDESDASFVDLPSFIGAVTNVEPEHLEFVGYGGSFEKQKTYFEKYVAQIPADGLCVICVDDLEAGKIYQKFKMEKKNLVAYSIQKSASKGEVDLSAKNIKMDVKGLTFDIEFSNKFISKLAAGEELQGAAQRRSEVYKDIHRASSSEATQQLPAAVEFSNKFQMPVYGRHNASNALVAIAIGKFLGIDDTTVKKALGIYNGVKRRFTKVGEYNGVAIIDDYGHHPTEIKTTLKAAKEVVGQHQVICVFEPHKYTRVRDVFNEFCHAFSDADHVIVSDIYSAGQAPIEGISQDSLIEGIKKSGQKNVIKLTDVDDLAKIVKTLIKPGDMVFCTGAGKVTYWAADLEKNLKNLEKK